MFRTLRSAGLALALATAASVPAFAAVTSAPALPDVGQSYLTNMASATALTSEPATPDVGQSYRPNAADAVAVESPRLLPPGSNGQGEPQSANSLPPGFMNGTPAMAHRLALQSYWARTGQ